MLCRLRKIDLVRLEFVGVRMDSVGIGIVETS